MPDHVLSLPGGSHILIDSQQVEILMGALNQHERYATRLLWVIELIAFVLIIGVSAVGYTVAS